MSSAFWGLALVDHNEPPPEPGFARREANYDENL